MRRIFLILLLTSLSAISAEVTSSKDYWVAREMETRKVAPLVDYKNYDFLFVPGFLYDVYVAPKRYSALRRMRAGEYFDEMRRAVAAAGIFERIAEIDSEDSVAENSADLAIILDAMPGPIVLITHSKGGLETLETLLEYPHLRKKIALWVSLQTPFFGSQIADATYPNDWFRAASKHLLEYWGGTLDSFSGLQTEFRKNYMHSRESRIKELVAEMKIVSVGTWIDGAGGENGIGVPALLPLQAVMNHNKSGPNDGMVSLASSRLPGTRWIKIAGLDHADPVMPMPSRKMDRAALLQVILNEYHAELTGTVKLSEGSIAR